MGSDVYHFPKVKFSYITPGFRRFGFKVSQRCLDVDFILGLVCVYWYSWNRGDSSDPEDFI